MARSGPITKDTSTIALGLAQIRVGKSDANISQTASVLTAADSMGAMASTKFTSNVEYWKLMSGFPQLEDMVLPLSETAALECEFKEISPRNLAIARGLDPFSEQDSSVVGGSSVTSTGATSGNISTDNAGGVVNDEWTVVFTSSSAVSIYGKSSGYVNDFSDLTSKMEPDNGGNPYFSIPANFFTGTWAADDVYTFTTTAYQAADTAMNDPHSGSIGLGQVKAPEFIRVESVYTYPNQTNHMYIIFPRANATSSLEIEMQTDDNANPPITFEAKRADSEVTGGNAVWNSSTLGIISFD